MPTEAESSESEDLDYVPTETESSETEESSETDDSEAVPGTPTPASVKKEATDGRVKAAEAAGENKQEAKQSS